MTERTSGRVLLEALAAARRLDALGHQPPTVMAVHPTSANPFQPLTYRRTWENGIGPVPMRRWDELDELLPLPGLGIRTILHLHWTNAVLQRVPDEAAGRIAISAFLDRLDRFLDGGGRLVWTVHNVLPHDVRFHALEAELQQAVVDRAAAIHILAAGTIQATADWFTIPPDRVIHVPLPSYRGAYADIYSPHEARHRLEIDPDDVVYGLVGRIKPYKGLTILLDAFDRLIETDPRPRRLLIAGPPDQAPATAAFLERAQAHPRVTVHPRAFPDDEMQLFLRATDLAVLPYEDVLNSSVLFLALTFGLPVIVPAAGGIGEEITPAFGRTFVPGDLDSLIAALRAGDELLDPSTREGAHEAALAVAAEHDPDRLGERFARAVLSRVYGDLVLPYGGS